MCINNYAVLGHFGPFWAVLGRFGPFWAILCPDFGKSFFPKTRMPQKGTCLCPIGADCTPGKRQNIYFGNKNAPKRDMLRPIRAPIAPPENGKTFILETRMPQKGTCCVRPGRRLHPLKTRKVFFQKHKPLFLGL